MERVQRHVTDDPELAKAAAVFQSARPRLFGIAYRVLGQVADAEDVVQEVWLRWQRCDRRCVRQPEAFLVTAVTRAAISATHTARARHESYVGPWLPDPVDTSDDPALGAERDEALELAVLLLLERLQPAERAAYVLRTAFEYPYSRIAEIVQTTQTNARQLVSRARKHLATGELHPVYHSAHRRLLGAFVAAAHVGDVERLESVLARDV
jgi:RNA polymerase sigma-70 factor (ECF subfamily)